MTPPTAGAALDPVPLCAALADETRWAVLKRLGARPATASELAAEFPVTRQAIAKHLAVLAEVGLVEPVRDGRGVRYHALGAPLTRLARDLETIGRGWERRLDSLAELAEGRARSARPAPPDSRPSPSDLLPSPPDPPTNQPDSDGGRPD